MFSERNEQIVRVEELSDAYHLTLGGDVMVTYLLEVTRQPDELLGDAPSTPPSA